MSLQALNIKSEIRSAHAKLVQNFQNGAVNVRKWVGWKGGSGEFDVYWRPAERMWPVLEANATHNRYWCCFGTDDPTQLKLTAITESS